MAKINRIVEHIRAGNWQKAVALAAQSQYLGVHAKAIKDAHVAYTMPSWTRQLGKDPSAVIAAGHVALLARYEKET